MRSIRLSLILYFLLLLGVALGAVSFRVYKSNLDSVAEKRDYGEKLLYDNYRSKFAQAKEALDIRLSRRVQAFARLAKNHRYHVESLYPIGALGSFALPNGHLFGPTWLAQGLEPALAIPLFEMQPPVIHIPNAEAIMASVPKEQPLEYFQTFDVYGKPQEKSESMGTASFADAGAVHPHTPPLEEIFDDTTLDGIPVRRVTLKAVAPTIVQTTVPRLWRDPPPDARWTDWRNKVARKDPEVFIQYASMISGLQAEQHELKEEYRRELSDLDLKNAEALASLRDRLLWISLLTFIAVLVGGFWLIRAGLSPLHRLSLAVSRVSERDFDLRIRPEQFPSELEPIAACLTETFAKLQRAFEREKQAVADISHELRTPLASFLANLEVILRKPRSAEEYRQVLEDCRDAGQHLSRLVERLLTLARLDAGSDTLRPRQVDVCELAQQCASMVRPLADARGVQIRMHIADSLPMLADPDKIREIFNNLLHNAIEYNRPNGSIDFTVDKENGSIRVEVRDTGIGIPEDARERIFERFYRADASRHADSLHAGIGLAIVKSYVDLMDGTISVDSDDHGSTFRILLPTSGYRIVGT